MCQKVLHATRQFIAAVDGGRGPLQVIFVDVLLINYFIITVVGKTHHNNIIHQIKTFSFRNQSSFIQ